MGSEVEEAARHLAGNLGVPDFVYEPATVAKGHASREVSDGLLACGNDGLILQVKTRDASAGTADDPAKSERWIRKEAERARAQADGTRRTLGDGDIKLTSLRGYERTFTDIPSWPAVVILAHPALPGGIVLDEVADTMWITLRDWLALHERLRSTAAVIRYAHRALASPLHPALGAEEDRYNALAAADLAAEGGPDSVPALPTSTPTGRSAFDASFIADLIQKVWPRDGHFPWEHPDEYRRIVEGARSHPSGDSGGPGQEDAVNVRRDARCMGPPQLLLLGRVTGRAVHVRLRRR